MTDPHLRRAHRLRVEAPPERFAALVAAMADAGLRAGWLDLAPAAPAGAGEPAAPPAAVPADLEAAAVAGVLRAVALSAGRSVAVKPRKGEPVWEDLLREHFRGCALVLVRGEVEAPPLLTPDAEGGGWSVAPPGGAVRSYTTAELVAALRRPRPWG
jgi:hypothetical protein